MGHVVDEEVSVHALSKLRYRFQCREWSAATGLVNFRARWYDSVTGRWLSKDPIGLNGGLNLYAFCGNNPIGFRDPFGHKRKKTKDDDNHDGNDGNILDSDVVDVITDVASALIDAVVDKNASPKMATALSTAEAIANGAEVMPDVLTVTVAHDGIQQIENMADPSGATLSSEDGMKALENLEQSIRSNLRNFNNLK